MGGVSGIKRYEIFKAIGNETLIFQRRAPDRRITMIEIRWSSFFDKLTQKVKKLLFKSDSIREILKKLQNRLRYSKNAVIFSKGKVMSSSEEIKVFTAKQSSSFGFYLSNDTDFLIYNAAPRLNFSRWLETAHTAPSRFGLIIGPGEKIVFPSQHIYNDYSLYICFGSGFPDISKDGLTIKVDFIEYNKAQHTILTYHLEKAATGANWVELSVDLSHLADLEGSLSVECNPGQEFDASDDLVAVYEAVLCRTSDIILMRARAFRDIRIANELAHFTAAYKHEIYNKDKNPKVSLSDSQKDKKVTPRVNAYALSNSLLLKRCKMSPLDFGARFAQKAEKGSLRVLSLCCGAARIEAKFAALTKRPVYFTLFDLNEKLLYKAKSRLPLNCTVEIIKGDINQIKYSGDRYDIIICVSALHHVVELEAVCLFISGSLVSDGEFWSIGEYIGRNGNRLWPEAYAIANNFFKELPEKYRINHYGYSGKQVDVNLPDLDCSIKSFEGIRSQDITKCLNYHFEEIYALKFNCFLWRLFDQSYMDNYDTEIKEDRDIIESAVDLEFEHFNANGLPTALFGIYRPQGLGV